jgi:hypothetical protein
MLKHVKRTLINRTTKIVIYNSNCIHEGRSYVALINARPEHLIWATEGKSKLLK